MSLALYCSRLFGIEGDLELFGRPPGELAPLDKKALRILKSERNRFQRIKLKVK